MSGKSNGHSNGTIPKPPSDSSSHRDGPPPPGTIRTLQYYPAIALAYFVWAITPLSWLRVSLAIYHKITSGQSISLSAASNGHHNILFKILWYHALLEIPFSIYLQYLTRKAQKRLPPPELNNKLLVSLLIQCLEVGTKAHPPTKRDENVELDDFIVTDEEAELAWIRFRKWFHHSRKSEIYADNVREWLAWAFAGRELSECQNDPSRNELVEKGLRLVQSRLKHTFPEGKNPNCKALRLTLDPVPTMSRPLGYYVVCNGMTYFTHNYMIRNGFNYVEDGKCKFLVLPKKNVESDHLPIVFLHGLGIGLGQYFAFIRHLKNHKSGVVVLVQPHISALIMDPGHLNPPDSNEQIRAIKSVVKNNGFGKATILSHSNGTLNHGTLVRKAPEICGKHVLTDPVCFRLWEGQTAYSFIARRWASGIEVLLGYFVAREVGIATTIARRFIWTEMAVWAHDLDLDPSKLQIVFGEVDLLVDVPACLEYLRDSGVPAESIHVCKGAQHGKALFFDSEGMEVVRKAVGLQLK